MFFASGSRGREGGERESWLSYGLATGITISFSMFSTLTVLA